MPLAATHARLAPHGTYWRAAICSDSCADCKPLRMEMAARQRDRYDAYLNASREGKRARGRA